MFCVLCRRLFWRDPKPEGRLSSRSRTRAVRRAAVETRSSVRAMIGPWKLRSERSVANAETEQRRPFTAWIGYRNSDPAEGPNECGAT